MKIYFASKTRHAHIWRAFRALGLEVISTWIDEAGPGESKNLEELWGRCLTEAMSCDVLIAYKEQPDVLKGAFVELGAALGVGTPVICIGFRDESFLHAQNVHVVEDFVEAFTLAKELSQ